MPKVKLTIGMVFSYLVAMNPTGLEFLVYFSISYDTLWAVFLQNPSSGSLKAFPICFRSESRPFRGEFIWSRWNRNAGHIVIGVYFWPRNAARWWRNPTWLPETTVRAWFHQIEKTSHTTNTFLLSWNSLYVYSRGTLGCLLGFWPPGLRASGPKPRGGN